MTDVATPIPAQPFSLEKTKAEMTLALSKEGMAYQNLLQEGEDVVFTEDNVNEERSCIVNLRKVKKSLEDVVNPYTEKWQGFNAAKKSLLDPVLLLLTKKNNECKKVAQQIDEKNRKIKAENDRKDRIKTEIDTFFLDQSQAIAGAKTSEDLVSIEKRIGSHKANKSRYEEFLPTLIEKADELTPLIKTQKEAIKKLEDLKKQEEAALKSGDDQAVLDARDAQEAVTQKIDENKIVAQETAIGMTQSAGVSNGGYARPVTSAAPKARRTTWEMEMKDLKELLKKSPDLLDMTLNKEKAKVILKTLKDSGQLEGKTEITLNGVRYFEEKSY